MFLLYVNVIGLNLKILELSLELKKVFKEFHNPSWSESFLYPPPNWSVAQSMEYEVE